ncbi:hypothetical protein SAMN05216360_101184 [Methylobacterium phyllostachyos]|uniref:Uncharacterized protein n=1 Tax=Methylobacterium phyllostachyos TaxID=582672 RepID=A0A1G9RBI3_9HYPH|nr:hypothetical protein [Methylobacterium phyllostachyos]SDM20521.1 hypothetical protein SAMN05216360_101184 [Methylobacterium phyllostachyos]
MIHQFYGKFPLQRVCDNGASSAQGRVKAGGRQARRLPVAAKIALAAACTLGLAACVTPQERHAMDQNQCYTFGFEPGTDAFAQCMMGLHQDRAAAQAASNRYWQAQLAEQNRRREAQQDLYKVMSLQRSGDPRFPVCGASYEGGMDHRTMTWFGPNCRAR